MAEERTYDLPYHWVTAAHKACQKHGFVQEAEVLKSSYIDHYTGGTHVKYRRPEDKVTFMMLLVKIQGLDPDFSYGLTPARTLPPQPVRPEGDKLDQSVTIGGQQPGGDGVVVDRPNRLQLEEEEEEPLTSKIEGDMGDLQLYYSWLETKYSEGQEVIGPKEFVEITRAARQAEASQQRARQKAKQRR